MYKILRWFGGVGFKGADRRYKTGWAKGPKMAAGRPSSMCKKTEAQPELIAHSDFIIKVLPTSTIGCLKGNLSRAIFG